jgi:hypothetical protein
VWAISEYIKKNPVQEFKKTSKETVDEAALLYDELRVARYYISKEGDITIRKVVERLRPVLSDQWVEMFYSRSRSKLYSNALDILSEEYGGYFTSYDDVIELGIPF